ncbi:MAG TPA: SCO family protein [Candidatus Limnocylindrales bacterium]|nr:SCO family protein [Candidatus Limnocylindrales bacterium]
MMTNEHTDGSGKTARAVLIGVLALGLALVALVLVVTVSQGSTPEEAPSPRLTNTPNIGAGGITPVEPGVPVPGVTLAASTGGEMSLSDFQGQYMLLYFGYTNCPDYCPTTMAKWVQVRQGLGDAADDVAFVMISIDPRRDTPEVMAAYLAQFDPAFVGLVADDAAVIALASTFGLAVNVGEAAEVTEAAAMDIGEATAEATESMPGMNTPGHSGGDVPTYLVDHTIASYLIDREGKLRAIFEANTPAADMRAYIESIMFADSAD